jgi:hypothetical protein
VGKLRLASEKNPAEEIVEQDDALAAGMLKILCVERNEGGRNPEMLGVLQHYVEQRLERMREALTPSRSHGQHLIGFGVPPVAPQAESFIQMDAEHMA